MVARIMHFLPWITSGGPERRRLELARHLDRSRYQLSLATFEAKPEFIEAFSEHGIEVYVVGQPKNGSDWRPLLKLYQYVIKTSPDILHGAVWEGCMAALTIGRLARVPLVVIEETTQTDRRSFKAQVLAHLMFRAADCGIAVSDAVAEMLRRDAKVPKDRLVVIENGISRPAGLLDQDARARFRASLGYHSSHFVVGTVGRLTNEEHKRFRDIIEAMAGLRVSHPEARLLIVGGGKDEAMLREFASQCGIDDIATFVGFQFEIGPYLSAMDVFALASAEEAFGLAVAEAMHASLPTVVTRVGALPRLVQDGITGMVVEARSPRGLEEALRRYAESPDIRWNHGARAACRAAEEFGSERYVRDVDALYRRLLLDGPRCIGYDDREE